MKASSGRNKQHQEMYSEFDTPLDGLFIETDSDFVQHQDGYDQYYSVNISYDENPFYSHFGTTSTSTGSKNSVWM